MAKESKGEGIRTHKTPADKQAEKGSSEAGSGRIWVRDDGAICIENECIVIQPSKDGAVDFTIDPAKCSCEVGSSLYESILKSALSGKGTRITIKPTED